MSRRPLQLPALATVALLAVLPAALAATPDEARREAIWEWTGVPRVVAIGDLHGGFDKLVRLIQSAGLVDSGLAWTGGEDHFVVAGDFLDRGSGGRDIMDLLRRLQDEAAAAGGRVHVLLGNHEALNLMRDTRYVSPAGFRAFAADETRAERQAGWRAYSRSRLGVRPAELRHDFHNRFPAGYFARQRLFDLDGEYGAWLISLPAIVKIDGVVYLHGGLTEEFAALGVDGINRRVHDTLRRHLELRAELEAAGLLSSALDLTGILERAAEIARRSGHRHAKAAAALYDSAQAPALGSRGPLWYRGTALEDERIERQVLRRGLELLDAKAMVIAHTYTGGNRITSRFHGTLYRVDHGILESEQPLALVVERGNVLVLDPVNGDTRKPVRELPTGSSLLATHPDLTPEERIELLRAGEVTHSVELGRGSSRPRLLVLEKNGSRARGIFKTIDTRVDADTRDRYQHEVAAYELDLLLGLGLVPPTLVRTIDGEEGSLQSWVEGAVDSEAASEYGLNLRAGETTRRQLAHGRLFDALIGNAERKPDDVLLMPSRDEVFLIDHSRAFSVATEVSWEAEPVDPIEPDVVARLRSLDRAALESSLGALLGGDQIDALLARCDALLVRLDRARASALETAVASDRPPP